MAIFPSATVGSIEKNDDIAKVNQYLRKLNDDLTYMFNNLTPDDNWSASAPKLIYSVDENGEASFEISSSGIKMRVASDEYVKSNVEILDNKISLKVSKGEVNTELTSELTLGDGYIEMAATDRLRINSGNFTLDDEGNATFKGAITSGSTITGTSFSGGSISIGGTTNNPAFAVDGQGNLTATKGSIKIGGTALNPTFHVDANGNLTATSATITGGSITIGTDANNNPVFQVDQYGNVIAKSGTFSGMITASSSSQMDDYGLEAGSNFYVYYYGNSDYDIGVGRFYFDYDGGGHGHNMHNGALSSDYNSLALEAGSGDIYCHEIYPWSSERGGRWQHGDGLIATVEWIIEQLGGGGDDEEEPEEIPLDP